MIRSLTILIGAASAALATFTAPVLHAAPTGAQLGPIQLGGPLQSGGTLSYQLNVTVTSPGTLTSRASIRSKGWKATFPDLSASPAFGVSLVDSPAITVPTNFTGPAVLRVRSFFNGKRIGSARILLTISAPPVVPPLPQATWYDVGFGTNVVVTAEAVSTNGLVEPLSYAWAITDTDIRTQATFSASNVAAPTFNTLPITSFAIDIEKEFDLATNPNLVGIDAEQVEKSTYHLQVIVTDANATSRTGMVTVISSSVSPGQPTIAIGERQYFTAEPNGTNASTYAWSLIGKPVGSTAVLEKPTTRTPSLRPDREGEYAVQLTVRGGNQTNTSYFTVNGANFVGVSSCVSCHGPNGQVGLKDIHSPWSQTGHATFFQRAVDGQVSSHYNENCVSCHTVGYNKAPLANNGGFDDVQKQVGWKFPTVLQVGNFAAMPSALRDKSNISCESCHGPGSIHPGSASASLDVAVCATCHQDGKYHNKPYQWSIGPHGNDDDYLVSSEEEAPNPSCAKCHSPASFVDHLKGKALTRLEAGRLTCQGCHDSHNEKGYPAQVRIFDTVTLDDATFPNNPPVLTGQGTSALCIYCHNGRRSPPATFANSTQVPHGGSTAADVLFGIRASTNVQVIIAGVTNDIASVKLENSAHAGTAKCVDCHMHKGSNTVGDHTFSTTDRLTGADNIASCNKCHDGVDPITAQNGFDHISVVRAGIGIPNGGDYDGDGVIEGIQSEMDGLQANLRAKMLATGMVGFGRSARYSTDPLIRAVQRNAAWNDYLIYRDLSHGVHNTAFAVRLLQWSYTVLSTNTGGNAYAVDFPSADLR